jgi:hypothetical protein
MDLIELANDPVKEAEGTWVRYDAKTEFLIAAAGEKYQRRVRELRDPILKALPRGDKITDEIADGIVTQAIADCVLLGWRGLQINGQELPFSKENALAALREKRLRIFRAWVLDQASTFENFKLENYEDLLGNFPSSSATTVQ